MQQIEKIIGREKEQAALLTAANAAKEGKGSIVLLAGEAGAGKTRLAQESLAATGLQVLRGKAAEEKTPPYGPVTGVLRDFLRQSGTQKLDCGALSPYLALILPELGAHPEHPKQETLIEAIVSAFDKIVCASPTAVFLDDLHWADSATLEIIPVLAERFQRARLLILGSYRSDEIPRGHRLRWLRNELRRAHMLQEISVGPLDQEESAAVITHVLGAPPAAPLAKVIFEKTLGIPLFVEELSAALQTQERLRESNSGFELISNADLPIPGSVRDAVLLRLDGLPEQTRRLLDLAAVAGAEFDLTLVTTLAEDDSGLDELFDRNWLVETAPGRAGFRHALTREAVHNEILWSQRRTLNRRIAEFLETSGALAGEIAEHWLAAHDLPKARAALLASAERSCGLHAYRDATQTVQRALDIWPEGEDELLRLQALASLAQCAQLGGQLSEATRALRELTESKQIKNDKRRLAETFRSLATVYGLQGAWEQYLVARTSAASAFEEANLPGEAATEWLAAARRNLGMQNLSAAVQLCDRARELAESAGDWDLQARALAVKGDALSNMGKSEEGIKAVEAGLELALAHNLTDTASEVYRRMGSALEYASQFTASRDAYFTAYNYCQSQGVADQARMCLGCMTYVLYRTGDWKGCIEVCREVINEPASPAGSRCNALGTLGLVYGYRGEVKRARKYIEEAKAVAMREKITVLELIAHGALAQLDEIEGNTSNAEMHYRQLLEMRQTLQDKHDSLPVLCSAVTFFATHGRKSETAQCVKALSEMAAATGNPEALAALAYALGESALLNDNPQEAAQRFQQAVSSFEKVEVPIEQLKAEFRAGVAHARVGAREAAVDYLKGAYRLARNLGCRPLAGQISAELDALGEVSDERRSDEAPGRAARAGLTRRQSEIIRLISDGLTDKEIAGRLFLSPRTVEMHVSNLLSRLDCRSRSEAVRRASELGLLN